MSSFRKRNVQVPLPGTRTSPQTGQVITSSGNPSMDQILGGGLAIGSLCLIEEDKYVTHSKVLAKYFLAEGLLSEHFGFLASLDDDPVELLRKLPKPLNKEELREETSHVEKNCGAAEDPEASKNGLRIAWRYNDLPIVTSEQTTAKIGHHFNLLEYMDSTTVDFGFVSVWNDRPHSYMSGGFVFEDDDEDTFNADEVADLIEPEHNKDVEMTENAKNAAVCVDKQTSEAPMDIDGNNKPAEEGATAAAVAVAEPEKKSLNIFHNPKYMRLLTEINNLLCSDRFHRSTGSNYYHKSLCRICITSLGSPLWYDDQFSHDILKFFTVLRAAVRRSISVCFITLPMHLVAKCDPSLVSKIRNLVDYSIELESFAGSERETNPAFRDYNGLFHLHKMTAINTLSAFVPETSDLAFKLRRKKFVIEKLHLPPELQDANNENQTESVPTLSCGAPATITTGTNTSKAAASLDF